MVIRKFVDGLVGFGFLTAPHRCNRKLLILFPCARAFRTLMPARDMDRPARILSFESTMYRVGFEASVPPYMPPLEPKSVDSLWANPDTLLKGNQLLYETCPTKRYQPH